MNAFANNLYRDVVCAGAATLITLVLGMSFVTATAEPYGARLQNPTIALQAQHGWFGEPEPAVLVD